MTLITGRMKASLSLSHHDRTIIDNPIQRVASLTPDATRNI